MDIINRTIVLTILIGVLQACIGNPIAVGVENNATKVFTEEELEMARNAGVKDHELLEAKEVGLDANETIKIAEIMKNDSQPLNETALLQMAQICKILTCKHKDQEIHNHELMALEFETGNTTETLTQVCESVLAAKPAEVC